MRRYSLKKVEGKYVIWAGDDPVLTPGGNSFSSAKKNLAALVCEDMCQFGHEPFNSLSYVTLHASYTDFGSTVPKSELARSILMGYTPDWDIALAQLHAFDSLESSPFVATDSADTGIILDPMIHFGPPEEIPEIEAWLENLSLRALCSTQVCGATFQSILLAYRLLQTDSAWPITNLGPGIIKASDIPHPLLFVQDDSEETEKRAIIFLEKIRSYAFFPDEDTE